MLRVLYRMALLILPAEVRRERGEEMEQVFFHCVGVERRRRSAIALPFICIRAVVDTLLFAMSVRRDALIGPAVSVHAHTRQKGPIMRKQDIRSALRLIRTQPMFTASIVLMLALGIGATTAIFSVVRGVLLEPLPFPDADRLVQVWGAIPSRNLRRIALSEANAWDVADMNRSFSALGSWHGESFTLTGSGDAERLSGGRVSTGFLRALSPRTVLGRLFQDGDDAVGAPGDRAILSHRFWTLRFGADRDIVGKTVVLNGRRHEVVGVLAEGMTWLLTADVLVPEVRRANANRGSWEYTTVGRLKDGVTMEAATADLERVMRELEAQYPETNRELGIAVGTSRAWVASDAVRRTLWMLLGATSLLLVIACANVANLLLASAASRVRETAVRAALGARRIDLVRQRLTEAGVLSLAGALVGSAVAWGMLRAFKTLDPGGVPRLANVTLDAWTLLFTVGIAIVVAAVTGVAPALRAPIADVVNALRQSQRGSFGSRQDDRLRRVLVAIEVALSVTMLVGAGLLVRSLLHVMNTDRGFATESRLLATVSVPSAYPDARRTTIVETILARVEALPQVAAAAVVSARPLSPGSTGLGIVAAGSAVSDAAVPWASWRIVTKDYFDVMGLPLMAGRHFTEQDIIEKPWRLIVSKRLADQLWPGKNPVGQTAILWKGQGNLPGEVIGVVGNMRERGLENDPTLAVYFPAYGAMAATTLQLVIHTRQDPRALIPTLQTVVRDVDANLPVSDIHTLEDVVNRSVATRRFTMVLLTTFAGLALILSAAGVYGVLAYSIARRTTEFGVRLALGASPAQVVGRVLSTGMAPVLVGLTIGALASFWLSRLMTSLLFGVQPNDPLTYVLVSACIVAVAALACYVPARRVLRVDPAVALRAE
jgi:putative ABC transport system permease protein